MVSAPLEWVDEMVADREGRRLGRVDAILVDRDDGDPRWVLVRLAGGSGGYTALPLNRVEAGAGHLDVPFLRDAVDHAPRVGREGALTARDERRLCAFFGCEATPGSKLSLFERRRTISRAVRRGGANYTWEPRPRSEWRGATL